MSKYLTGKRTLFFIIFGLIAFVLYLYFFVGFKDILLVIRTVSFSQFLLYYPLAIGAIVLVMLLWVASWAAILKTLNVEVSIKNCFLYYWSGYFVDLVLPCQQVCGEVTRLYLVQRETKRGYGILGAAGVTNRTVSYSVIFVGLTVGVVYLLAVGGIPPFASGLLILSWLGAFAYLMLLLYLSLSDNAAKNIVSFMVKVLRLFRVKRFRQGGLSPSTIETLRGYREGFEFFQAHPQHLIKPIMYQAISYIVNVSVYVLVFFALGLTNLTLGFFILVFLVAGAIQGAASAFSVGALEILLTNIFVFFGITVASSSIAAAVLRSVIFWFPLVVGYIIIQLVGAKGMLSAKTRAEIEAAQRARLDSEKSQVATSIQTGQKNCNEADQNS